MTATIAAGAQAADALRGVGAFLAARGWLPATSGNLSVRLDAATVAITRSGIDKGAIGPHDTIAVRLNEPLPGGVSAETPLHLARYSAGAAVGCVLHVHSVASTVLSRLDAERGEVLLRGYEMQKAFAGMHTHEGVVRIPIFENSQDMPQLAREVEAGLALGDGMPGYLLSGHGLYAWGRDVAEARRHVEGFEFLLACALEERRLLR